MDKQFIAEEMNNLHYATLKRQLMLGEIITVNRDTLEKLLYDMDDINTFSIQKSYDGVFWCKVDNVSVREYKEKNDEKWMDN